MIRKLFICILFLVIGALAQANFDLSPTLASHHDASSLEALKSTVAAMKAEQANLHTGELDLQAAQADLLLGQADLLLGQANLQTGQADLMLGQGALEQGALQFMTVVEGPINGMPGPHIIITGANLHIRSGEGVTNGANTGVGNLVVGYNEEPTVVALIAGDRAGTHNLIVGPEHKYLSFGRFLAGRRNTTSGENSSVSGGMNNTASGWTASVSGGASNTASSESSSVSGGASNTASALYASVSGGTGNTASGDYASVSGGDSNTASGASASVSGGVSRTAPAGGDWAAGSLFEDL